MQLDSLHVQQMGPSENRGFKRMAFVQESCSSFIIKSNALEELL